MGKLFFQKEKRRIIAVLGMHRSGTSCLTGLLENAGGYLGHVSKKNPYNLRGNQENQRIMHLHDVLLADSGATWDKPPNSTVVWRSERKRELENIIKEYAGEQLWAFKDPRTLFTLNGWLKMIPDLHFIGTFRHPSAVAQSLYNREKMPLNEAFHLWYEYNERLLFYQEKFEFDIVDFNLEPKQYLASVRKAFNKMGLLSSGKLHFFDSSLRHTGIDDSQSLPIEMKKLYQKLLESSL